MLWKAKYYAPAKNGLQKAVSLGTNFPPCLLPRVPQLSSPLNTTTAFKARKLHIFRMLIKISVYCIHSDVFRFAQSNNNYYYDKIVKHSCSLVHLQTFYHVPFPNLCAVSSKRHPVRVLHQPYSVVSKI